MKSFFALSILCASSLAALGTPGDNLPAQAINSGSPNTPVTNGQTPDEQAQQSLRDEANRAFNTPDANTPASTPSNGYGRNNSRRPLTVAEVDSQMQAAKTGAKYPLDTAKTFKDKQLNDKIRAKIEGWYADDYRGVILKTDDGIVTITGNIETDNLGNDLTDQVRKMDGVKQVRNRLKTSNSK